jgi:hypothetical protein
MELKDFISSLKGLATAEGVTEDVFIQMLKDDWKRHQKPIEKTIKKGSK